MDPRAPFPANLTCRWSWKWLRSSTTARHKRGFRGGGKSNDLPFFSWPEVWKKYLQMVVVNAAIFGGGFDPVVKICMRTRRNLGMNSPNDQLIGIENPDLLGSCD